MRWRGREALLFANGIAVALGLLLLADAAGVLPRIGGGATLGTGNGYGLVYSDTKASSPGYTLIAPLRGNTAYLIDWYGKIFHEWRIPGVPELREMATRNGLAKFGTLQAKLLLSGNLLVGYGGERFDQPKRGAMPVLLELDWGGNVVWRYENELMHHDFERLPNGNTAVIVWEKLPENFANGVKGGIPGTGKRTGMHSDAILEIDGRGEVVWRWALWEHLNPDLPENVIPSWNARNIWTVLSSVIYVEDNPITRKPAYLVSVQRFSTVMLIERESGRIIWRGGGREMLASPASTAMTEDGNILAFDNGDIPQAQTGVVFVPHSKVVELRPAIVDGTKWVSTRSFVYAPEPPAFAGAAFFTPNAGSVQELENGNILVSAGVTGRIFEIEKATKRVVWDYISPFGFALEGWPTFVMNAVYSAHRYPPGFSEFLK